MTTFTLASTRQLIAANDRKYNQMNQKMDRKVYDRLDPDGIHVCYLVFPHNDVHPRTMWLVKELERDEPQHVTIDMTWEDLHALPTITSEEVEEAKRAGETLHV